MEPNGKGAERLDRDVERREAERKRREREAIAEMSGEPAEEPRETADPQENKFYSAAHTSYGGRNVEYEEEGSERKT